MGGGGVTGRCREGGDREVSWKGRGVLSGWVTGRWVGQGYGPSRSKPEMRLWMCETAFQGSIALKCTAETEWETGVWISELSVSHRPISSRIRCL